MLRSLLLVRPDEQRILLHRQMRRVQRVGVRLPVTSMVIRIALSAAGESEIEMRIDGGKVARDIENYCVNSRREEIRGRLRVLWHVGGFLL